MWPRPRPEIIGTAPPQAATIGASSRLTLSPTPPVECLSSAGPGRSTSDQSSTSPECVLWCVKAIRSSAVRPWSRIAIASAPTWASVSVPSAIPRTRKPSSSSVSSPPSRLRLISSAMCISRPRSALSAAPGRAPARAPSRSVCSWLTGSSPMPSAKLVIAETAATRSPQWRATIVSCTVDMPTASAPSVWKARISAGRLEARAGHREVDALRAGPRRCPSRPRRMSARSCGS